MDDDSQFLDALETVFSGTWPCAFFHSRQLAEPVLRRGGEALSWERGAFGTIAQAQSAATDDPSPMLRALEYFHDERRQEIVAALVVDFAMPGEDGISFCARNEHIGLQRMLLTGIANDAQAVGAFNQGIIERFLPKQWAGGPTEIADEIALLVARSAQRRAEVLAGALPTSFRRLLEQPASAAALGGYLAGLGVVEYLLLGVPQGLVCVHLDGTASWVQLDTPESLESQLEAIASEPERWEATLVERVRSGASVVNLHCAAELGGSAQESNTIDLLGDMRLLVAHFPLALPEHLQPVSERPVA